MRALNLVVVVVVAAALLTSRSLSAAETAADAASPRLASRYAQAGFLFGGAAPVAALNVMAAFDGGLRLRDSGAWLHAAVSYGAGGDDQGPGSNGQLRAGIEGRTCVWNGVVCGVDGIDVGYQRGRWSDRDDPARRESSDALVAIPRFGLDLGGKTIRARLGIEVDCALVAQHERYSPSGDTSVNSPGLVGLEANAGIAYQW